MERTYIKDVNAGLDGKKVLIKGWVYELRNLSKIKFILLRDMTGVMQAVALSSKVPQKTFEEIATLSSESVVEIEGTVKANKEAKKGYEVVVESIKVHSRAQPLPIPVFEKDKTITTDLAKRLDFRPVDLRKPENSAVIKIEAALVEGLQQELIRKGFLQVFTPCIMGVPSESGSEVFKINYYGTEAFLRQDPQLHRQLTILGGIEKLFDIGPGWRAELSHTTKHLCEHRVCAPEMAFLEDEHDTMVVEEEIVVAAIKNAREKCKEELELLNVNLEIPKTPFPELKFPEIYDILGKLGQSLEEGDDIDTESYNLLQGHIRKKYKTDFYFINRFPFDLKPFYVMRVDDDPVWARSVDLNFKNLELSSGGQREHRYEKLMEQVKLKGMDPKSVEWFTKFFKWGAPPHGGFAIGVERFTQALLGLGNIKETVLFPRDPERKEP